jgi:hypothetical protein
VPVGENIYHALCIHLYEAIEYAGRVCSSIVAMPGATYGLVRILPHYGINHTHYETDTTDNRMYDGIPAVYPMPQGQG